MRSTCTLWLWPSYAMNLGISLGTNRVLRMLRMVTKRMAIIKTGIMRIGPTMGVCSLLVQAVNVCAATVLCAPAATDFTKEGPLQQLNLHTTPTTQFVSTFTACLTTLSALTALPPGLPAPPMTPVSANSTSREPSQAFCLLSLNLAALHRLSVFRLLQFQKQLFLPSTQPRVPFLLHAQLLTLLRFMIYLQPHPLRPNSSSLGTNWQGGRMNYRNYAGKEGFPTTSETFLSYSAAEYETFLSIRSYSLIFSSSLPCPLALYTARRHIATPTIILPSQKPASHWWP